MLVGRMPPRGALLAFPQECEISKLAPLAGQGESSPKVRVTQQWEQGCSKLSICCADGYGARRFWSRTRS